MLERVSPAVHRRQVVTTTADILASVVADVAGAEPGDVIYDPCAGEGGLLLRCARAADGSVTAFAQELNADASRVARTRFLLEPVTVAVGEPGYDSVGEDQFPALRADVVVADPPVAARASLVGWVDHVVSHLADAGRGVVAIPAYAVTRLKESRRQDDDDLVARLDELATAGHVAGVAVLPSNFRRDVPGPITVWTLTQARSPGRAIALSAVGTEGPHVVMQPPREVAADELFDAIGTTARALGDARGRRSVERSESAEGDYARMAASIGEEVRRKLATITAELGPLLDQLPPGEESAVDRVRRSLQEVDDDLDQFG